MAQDEHEKNEGLGTTTDELGPDAELYADQEPQRYTYDPSKLRELSVASISEIEEAVSRAQDDGKSPGELQHLVYGWLENLGFDLKDIQHGALVARIVGVDGRGEIRAFVTKHTDFGTRVRNTSLVPVEMPQEEAVPDPEEEMAQERFLDELLQGLREGMQTISRNMVNEEQDRIINRNLTSLYNLVEEVQKMSRTQLRGGSVDAGMTRTLFRLVDEAGGAARFVRSEVEKTSDERTPLLRYRDQTLANIKHEGDRRLDDERKFVLNRTLNQVDAAVADLMSNRNKRSEYIEEMHRQVTVLVRNLDELRSSRYGYEQIGGALSRAVGNINECLSQYVSSRRKVPELVDNATRSLTPNR